MQVAIPSNSPGGLDATISPHFGRCEFFTMVEISNKQVKKVRVIENRGEHFGSEKTPAENLLTEGVNAIITMGMGPKAVALMRGNKIDVYVTSASTVKQAVQELIEGKARAATDEDVCKESREHLYIPPTFGPMYDPGSGMGRGMGRGMGGYPPFGLGYAPMVPQMPSPKTQGLLKVGVANQGPGGLEDMVSPMFGRCPSFTILEVKDKEIKNVKVIPNQFLSSPSGVGIAVVQMLAGEGVNYILGGRFGPNVSAVSGQFGIQMVAVPPGVKVKDAINQYIIGSH
ncbi:MAG: NifB/NifX family molybdenum-iron cluster-binding protein [Candidatus Hadarchaeaceae archaeon]